MFRTSLNGRITELYFSTVLIAGMGCQRPAYVGWQNDVITSNREREAAFQRTGGTVFRLPWKREQDTESDVAALLDSEGMEWDGILCGNGQIGLAVKRRLQQLNRHLPVRLRGRPSGCGRARAHDLCVQPLENLADATYERLAAQNRKRGWKARTVLCRGTLKLREAV